MSKYQQAEIGIPLVNSHHPYFAAEEIGAEGVSRNSLQLIQQYKDTLMRIQRGGQLNLLSRTSHLVPAHLIAATQAQNITWEYLQVVSAATTE